MLHPTTIKKTVGILVAMTALAVSLAGCAEAPVGRADTTTGNGAEAGGVSFDQWQLDYSQCMRDHGIDLDDPSGPAGGSITVDSSVIDVDAMMAAGAKCRETLGDPPVLSPEERATIDAEALEWARDAAECYRDAGYDMADPKPGEQVRFPVDASDEVIAQCGGGAGASSTGIGQ